MKIEGRFLRQVKAGYFARVYLDIELSSIVIVDVGKEKYDNNFGQGEIVKAPCSTTNFDDWIEGARLGIKYGLTKSRNNYKVIIEGIEGLFTDTNPLVISVAAIIGVWDFLEYQPSETEMKMIEQWALESWSLYSDSYPHELEQLRK